MDALRCLKRAKMRLFLLFVTTLEVFIDRTSADFDLVDLRVMLTKIDAGVAFIKDFAII